VERALAAIIREPAEELRTLELERLDEMARICWGIVHTRHYVISVSGKIPAHPVTGELIDSRPVLRAIDRLIRIGERRARLLGLDAPIRAEVRGGMDGSVALSVSKIAACLTGEGVRPPASLATAVSRS
jgi:hypothetical protein